MRVMREETFGPVLAVSPFEREEDAIHQANSTEYGLAAYVFTRDLARSLRLVEALEFGAIGVNSTAILAPQLAFAEAGSRADSDGRTAPKVSLNTSQPSRPSSTSRSYRRLATTSDALSSMKMCSLPTLTKRIPRPIHALAAAAARRWMPGATPLR